MANQFAPDRALFSVIAEKIRSLAPKVDISGVMKAVEDLLDRSIAAEGYLIRDPKEMYGGEGLIDLSKINFDALKAKFETSRKRMEMDDAMDAAR